VQGTWRFAGWEVAAGDSAALGTPLPGFGALFLTGQKRDSVGGSYVVNGRRAPLAGEVRRDSTLALVTFLAPGDGRYLVGTLQKDTVWLEMASLLDPGSWPNGAKAAFVRSAVAEPFKRMRGALSALARADSIRAATMRSDSVRADSLAAANSAAANAAGAGNAPNGGNAPNAMAPGGVVSPPPAPVTRPPVTRPPVSQPNPEVRPSVPTQAPRDTGARPTQRPVVPNPEPRPVDTVTPPPAAPPPLLGVPVPADTTRAGPGTNPE
jgi:hypothetical protein